MAAVQVEVLLCGVATLLLNGAEAAQHRSELRPVGGQQGSGVLAPSAAQSQQAAQGQQAPAATQSLWTSGAADFPCYRQPAIAPIPGTATLLAFVEGRFSAPCAPPLGQAELPYEVGGMNLRVSTDHGASWGPSRVIYGNATKQVRLPVPGRAA